MLDKGYELLEKARNAKSDKEALKLAQKAYKECPDCLDALLYQVKLENSFLKKTSLLDEGVEKERKRLDKEGYFKEDVGSFYGIVETRPYIRGLFAKAYNYALTGRMTPAKEVCKEIIRLNESDNTGARYLLMAVYAILEDEKEMLELYKKYSEKNIEMYFPLFALYYKLGNDKKAKQYLDKIEKVNPHIVEYFNGVMKMPKNVSEDYYSLGDESEVFMYFNNYFFLAFSIHNVNDYIIDYYKSRKNK